jgi:aminoglycoside 3-N-acetyltransferase
MSLRNLLRSLTPNFILSRYRSRKKSEIRKKLAEAKRSGKIITKADLIHAFQAIGIEKGDVLLVHSSLSAIGYVENGPKDVVDALLEAIGADGHLLMPNSPNASFQLDYIRQLDLFDVENSPSALGAISEWFRKLPNVERSAHPTEPVSCIGPEANWFISDHFGQLTPYNSHSPFSKVIQRKGKILYLGVSLSKAGKNLHTLEDAVDDFPFPVYAPEKIDVNVKFTNGSTAKMETLVHNPEQSKKRKCDDLLPLFLQEGALREVEIFQAHSLLFDAEAMFNVMLKAYRDKGVTMYTPNGR